MREDLTTTVPMPFRVRVRHGVRRTHNWLQLLRFAAVGASGPLCCATETARRKKRGSTRSSAATSASTKATMSASAGLTFRASRKARTAPPFSPSRHRASPSADSASAEPG